jgi:glycosyltransferase involved in cell wall biosynthesis
MKLSVIIPVYNEEKIISGVVDDLKKELIQLGVEYEIIAINDGSFDKSREILERAGGIKLINHPYNKGYGASLKTGARAAKYDYLLFFDADGQHKAEYIEEMIKHLPENDMVVGSRTGHKGPAIRQPGKKILTWIANYLVDQKIPDINSGFRLVRKNLFLKFLSILPNSFSASTTITLALLKDGYNVKYIPIINNARKNGRSSVGPKHAASAILLILRVIMLFNPLKIFMPLAFLLLFFAAALISVDMIFQRHISNSTGIIFLTGMIIFVLGLLADQIAAIRREIKR